MGHQHTAKTPGKRQRQIVIEHSLALFFKYRPLMKRRENRQNINGGVHGEIGRDDRCQREELLKWTGLKDFLKDKLINCIYMDVPLKVALERNAKREGLSLVPEDAIKRMYESAYRPNYGERYKYDKIYIVNEKGGISLL